MIKVAIWGTTGYTGLELIRLLLNHPEVKVTRLFSHTYSGEKFSVIYPHIERFAPINLTSEEEFERIKEEEFDLAFLALPSGFSVEKASLLVNSGKKVIDLSSDFRLKDLKDYETWYNFTHPYPELVREAVYGLPELNREKVKDARLVANPGCYPTSFLIGIAPILKEDLLSTRWLYVDSKSGTSGAGRKGSTDMSFSEMEGALKPYNVGRHRHIPEMEQEASLLARNSIKVAFTPSLAPISRGILTTIYATIRERIDIDSLYKKYLDFYRDDYFVRILPIGTFPSTKSVRGSNFCDIGLSVQEETVIVTVAIDNLMKGASGQAIQNMNIMYNLPENLGLNIAPLFP
ncbi:MAG: N-acetyl-gamma-glutamyl-phosphate reductase [bacterium]